MKKVRIYLLLFSIIFANNLIAQTVYTTKTGEKYHKENCRFLKYSKKETTIRKAKGLGFLACKVCKPTIKNTSHKNNTRSLSSSKKKQTTKKGAKKITATQCIGKTKSGSRCKRKTKNTNGRCYQH
jgi:hypothetical protein